MATTPTLLKLPPELIIRISTHFTTPELGDFRGTCRYIESSLFDSFAKEFFTKRQFMLEYVSLEALVGIANHKLLSSRLQDVIIGLDRFPSVDRCAYGDVEIASSRRREMDFVSQSVLLESGKARDMLVDAFSKLPNLRTVGLRDYSANGRRRDGENARWRSYGWSCGLDTTTREASSSYGLNPRFHDLGSSSTAFTLVLYALGQSSARPQSLEVFFRRLVLPHDSFDIVKSFLRPSMLGLLSGIRTMMLRVGQGDVPQRHDSITTHEYRHLEQFFSHAPNLTHLRLNFAGENYCPEEFLKSLVPSPTTSSSPSSHLLNLTTLELGMVGVSKEILLTILSRLKLTKLSLWKCALRTPASEAAADEWATFLDTLGNLQSTAEMKQILIGYVGYHAFNTSPGLVRLVKFARTVTTNANGEKEFEDPEPQATFRRRFGEDARGWLKDLATRAYLPEEPGSFPEEDNEDDDSEDDDSAEGVDLALETDEADEEGGDEAVDGQEGRDDDD